MTDVERVRLVRRVAVVTFVEKVGSVTGVSSVQSVKSVEDRAETWQVVQVCVQGELLSHRKADEGDKDVVLAADNTHTHTHST